MNRILIHDLKISCVIGCHDHERLAARELNLNIKVTPANLIARQSDRLADTVDYGALANLMSQKAKQTNYFLIEKLAQILAEACLEFDSRIQEVELELEKPGCIPNARSASVLLSLTRP